MAHVYNSQLDAFSLYHKVREEEENGQSSLPSLKSALPALGEALSGATGTALSHLLIYPLDLVITRLQVQKRQQQQHRNASRKDSVTDANDEQYYTNIIDAFKRIYKDEGGIAAFYTGVVEDTAKSIADSFLFFLAYTFVRRLRQRQRKGVLPIADELAIGMAAGAFARLLTTPVQNIVTRKQTAAIQPQIQEDKTNGNAEKMRSEPIKPILQHPHHPTPSIAQIARTIRREKGTLGFWSGYSATLILTLNPALTFFLHSLLSRFILLRTRQTTRSPSSSHPAATLGPKLTFLVAALSKAIASTITYPIGLAKARAQAGAASPRFQAPWASYEGWHERSEHKRGPLPLSLLPAVLRAVVVIAEVEGVGAVYSALGGEVVKGFLGHGLTMMLKERVHGGVVALWEGLGRLSVVSKK